MVCCLLHPMDKVWKKKTILTSLPRISMDCLYVLEFLNLSSENLLFFFQLPKVGSRWPSPWHLPAPPSRRAVRPSGWPSGPRVAPPGRTRRRRCGSRPTCSHLPQKMKMSTLRWEKLEKGGEEKKKKQGTHPETIGLEQSPHWFDAFILPEVREWNSTCLLPKMWNCIRRTLRSLPPRAALHCSKSAPCHVAVSAAWKQYLEGKWWQATTSKAFWFLLSAYQTFASGWSEVEVGPPT